MLYDLRQDSFRSLTVEKSTPNNSYITISGSAASNSSLTGAGTLGTNLFKIWTPGVNGGRLAYICVGGVGTANLASESRFRYYLSDLTGTSKIAIGGMTFPTNWPMGGFSNITLNWMGVLEPSQCILAAFSYVDSATAQFHISAFGEDF